MQTEAVREEQKHQPVASTRHSLVFLGIVGGVMIAGFAAQSRPVAGGGLVESHVHVIPIYLSVTVMDWLLFYFAWKGIRARGSRPRPRPDSARNSSSVAHGWQDIWAGWLSHVLTGRMG